LKTPARLLRDNGQTKIPGIYVHPPLRWKSGSRFLRHIQRSIKFKVECLAQELRCKNSFGRVPPGVDAEQARARRALELQHYLQQSQKEMLEHRRQTFAEIRNDDYLWLTGQEELYQSLYQRN
jgi:hypothetical protein